MNTLTHLNLKGVRVAVLVADGFNQVEFDVSVAALKKAGATVDVLASNEEQLGRGIRGVSHLDTTQGARATRTIIEAGPDLFDALLIPGGAVSVDEMRASVLHLGFVRAFMDHGKPIGVICHGAWLLADAGVLGGKTLTSWPNIRKDLERAGAVWKDQEFLVDGNLVSSRKPDDMAAFTQAFVHFLQGHVLKETSAA